MGRNDRWPHGGAAAHVRPRFSFSGAPIRLRVCCERDLGIACGDSGASSFLYRLLQYGYLWLAGCPLAGASLAFFGTAILLQWTGLTQTGLFVIDLLALVFTLYVLTKPVKQGNRLPPAWWDLPLRLVLITGLVLGVTLIAPHIGPGPSGVLASFPLMGAILGAFAHEFAGPHAARQVMHGMAAGLFGFAAFFYAVSLLLVQYGLPITYSCATACAVALQALTLRRIRRPAAR